MNSVDLFFDIDLEILRIEEPNGTSHAFDFTMLREVKIVLSRYEEASFHAEDNVDEFHDFIEKMGAHSPEYFDVEVPYLN